MAAACVLASSPARADDLQGALAAAYGSNPTLLAAREQLRAADAGVPLARADALPSASATASETEYVRQKRAGHQRPAAHAHRHRHGDHARLQRRRGENAIRAADTRVVAGRADLRSTEANVFAQVVAAYLDVLRTEATVRLNKVQVQTLETNLKATSDRFQIGDVTRTDVAQSQSRLALAVGNLRSAEAGLVQARETYIQLVGKAPEALKAPPPLPTLPAAPDEAVAVALQSNPDLAGAREARRPGSTLPPRAPRVCPRSACLPMWAIRTISIR
jgi:outer membrane protein